MQNPHHRSSRRVDAGSERHRHDLLPARRAERSVLRRPVRPHQRHPADPCAPRAGLRLHGAGLRHGDAASLGLCRRARAGLPQHHGGAVDGLRRERAGAGAHRPDPAIDDRPQCRPAARAARPARRSCAASPSGPTASPRRPRRPAWSTRPSAACSPGRRRPVGAGMRDGHLGAQGAGRVDRRRRRRPTPARSTRTASSAPPSCWAARSGR